MALMDLSGLIELDKFVASFITEMKECSQMRNFSIPRCIKKALDDQGLEYKDGKIVKIQHDVEPEFDDEYIQEWLISYLKDGSALLPYEPRFKRAIEWIKQQKSK
jgi:hypothetical protein